MFLIQLDFFSLSVCTSFWNHQSSQIKLSRIWILYGPLLVLSISIGVNKCRVSSVLHDSLFLNSSTTLKILCASLTQPSQISGNPRSSYYYYYHYSHSFAISKLSHKWNDADLTISTLYSLSNTHLRFICIFLQLNSPFVFITE